MASDAAGERDPAGPAAAAATDTARLDRVDFSDTTYRVSTGSAPPALVASIRRLGVLVPPLVREAGDRIVVISGFKRLDACRQLGIASLPARWMPAGAGGLDCARCAIAENALQRPLNLLEQARGAALLAAAVPGENDLAAEAAAAGLPAGPDIIAKLIRVGRLPAGLKAMLAGGAIGLSMALALGRREPEFAVPLAEIFGRFRIGRNRQREILELITEIAARDDRRPLELLACEQARKILADEGLEKPLRARLFRDWLYAVRYPELAAAEAAFAARRKRLKLGTGIQLLPPDSFESDQYTFTVRFRDLAELKDRLKRLDRIGGTRDLALILERSGD